MVYFINILSILNRERTNDCFAHLEYTLHAVAILMAMSFALAALELDPATTIIKSTTSASLVVV